MITGLDHFALPMPVGQEAQARAYYGELLGLTEAHRDPGLGVGGCWFDLPDGRQVHLQPTADFHALGRPHPCLLCSDLDGMAAHIEAAGYPIRWDERRAPLRRFFTRDPFGNRIEIMASEDEEGVDWALDMQSEVMMKDEWTP